MRIKCDDCHQWIETVSMDPHDCPGESIACPSCGEPMEYDEGQPMGYDQPDIQPEWFCECGETILAESLESQQ